MTGFVEQQFELFVYDASLDDGAFKAIGRVWATSEKEALVYLQRNTSRPMTMQEQGTTVVMNSEGLQFIARSHAEKHRWPKVDTGRLPQNDNPVIRADFQRGRI